MTGFFDRMLGRGAKEGSGAVAKNRLEVVLVHDRINLSPERLRELKAELLAVIAKYVPIDADSVAIAVEQPDRNSSRLVAQIPFGKGKVLNLASDDYTEDDDLDDDAGKSSADAPQDSPRAGVDADSTEAAAPSETAADGTGDTPPEKPASD